MRAAKDPRTLALELGIVLAVAAYYIGGNLLFEASRAAAIENTWDIIALQERIGLNWEAAVQDFFEPKAWASWTFVFFYAGPHFVLTWGFLAWAYMRRFSSYAHIRNSFALFTVTAFTFQWVFPVAPPRMIPELGFGDTVTGALPLNAETPWISTLVNDVAAVPSVHTGWALLVALFAVRLTTSPWRWAWFLYPAMIMISVVATANHFLWDIVTALAWLGLTETLHHVSLHRFSLPRLAPGPSTPRPVAEAEGE